MNVITCVRVSTEEQRDGYSLDAQQKAVRDKALREGWRIVKEFCFAETARKAEKRLRFNEMLSWLDTNAAKHNIGGILFHKLDRACRNMADAYRLKQLEEQGIKLLFCENHFGDGAAGTFSFNVLASVAQYYSDNLRSEVLKGMNEKLASGWLPGHPPRGYRNDTADSDEPIKVDPETSDGISKIFEWFAAGQTVEAVVAQLNGDGFGTFNRSTVEYILRNRFYVGDIKWHGRVFPGRHRPLVDRRTFAIVQQRLDGLDPRNLERGAGPLDLPFSNGLFRSRFDGLAITGERITKRQRDGSTREHVYYKSVRPGPRHNIRWKAADLDDAIANKLSMLRLPNEEIAEWFRRELTAALGEEEQYRKKITDGFAQRKGELEAKQNRLLDVLIGGRITTAEFDKRNREILSELDHVRGELEGDDRANQNFKELAIAVFKLSQNAAETWAGSNTRVKRELLECMCSNRELDNTTLYLTWRKPFDMLMKVAENQNGGGYRDRTGDLQTARHNITLILKRDESCSSINSNDLQENLDGPNDPHIDLINPTFGPQSGPQIGQLVNIDVYKTDFEALAQIVAAWPTLSPALKLAIQAIVSSNPDHRPT